MKKKMSKKRIIPFTLAFIMATSTAVQASAPVYMQLSVEGRSTPVIFDVMKVYTSTDKNMQEAFKSAIAYSFTNELTTDFFIKPAGQTDTDYWLDYDKVNHLNPYSAVVKGLGTTYEPIAPTATDVVTTVDANGNITGTTPFVDATNPIDFEDLDLAISNAKALRTATVVSPNGTGSDVTPDKQWVTSTVMSEFLAAIAAAETARSSVESTEEADGEANKLNIEINKFGTARKPGTAESETDKSVLYNEINRAEIERDKVEVSSENGEDISQSAKWVTPEDMAILEAAINKAQTVYDNPATTANEANTEAQDLETAIEDFIDAQADGTLVLEKTSLAIEEEGKAGVEGVWGEWSANITRAFDDEENITVNGIKYIFDVDLNSATKADVDVRSIPVIPNIAYIKDLLGEGYYDAINRVFGTTETDKAILDAKADNISQEGRQAIVLARLLDFDLAADFSIPAPVEIAANEFKITFNEKLNRVEENWAVPPYITADNGSGRLSQLVEEVEGVRGAVELKGTWRLTITQEFVVGDKIQMNDEIYEFGMVGFDADQASTQAQQLRNLFQKQFEEFDMSVSGTTVIGTQVNATEGKLPILKVINAANVNGKFGAVEVKQAGREDQYGIYEFEIEEVFVDDEKLIIDYFDSGSELIEINFIDDETLTPGAQSDSSADIDPAIDFEITFNVYGMDLTAQVYALEALIDDHISFTNSGFTIDSDMDSASGVGTITFAETTARASKDPVVIMHKFDGTVLKPTGDIVTTVVYPYVAQEAIWEFDLESPFRTGDSIEFSDSVLGGGIVTLTWDADPDEENNQFGGTTVKEQVETIVAALNENSTFADKLEAEVVDNNTIRFTELVPSDAPDKPVITLNPGAKKLTGKATLVKNTGWPGQEGAEPTYAVWTVDITSVFANGDGIEIDLRRSSNDVSGANVYGFSKNSGEFAGTFTGGTTREEAADLARVLNLLAADTSKGNISRYTITAEGSTIIFTEKSPARERMPRVSTLSGSGRVTQPMIVEQHISPERAVAGVWKLQFADRFAENDELEIKVGDYEIIYTAGVDFVAGLPEEVAVSLLETIEENTDLTDIFDFSLVEDSNILITQKVAGTGTPIVITE